jgi:Tol biopolymer transport system component
MVGLLAPALISAQTQAQPLPSFSEPAISPNGSEIAFIYGGDIWTVPAAGGEARLLVSHPASESRPLYSPDGRYLAFVSTRTGSGDIYLLTLAGGELKRLTFDDAPEQLDAWAPDGRSVYFSTRAHDIAGMSDIYRISIAGGTPMPAAQERYVNEFFAAPSPDGRTLALCARGIANSQWWRNGHSHLDESEIWTVRDGKYARLVEGGAKQLWPMWSPDGKTLYFVSDRNGAENIWRLRDGQTTAMTNFRSGRVLWPAISRNGKVIVFERDFGIWKLDLGGGQAVAVKIQPRGTPMTVVTEHRRISDRLGDLALSPDGKKVIFSARGELFAASAKDGGDGIRITNTPGRETQVAWAPDSKRIVYVSDRDGHDHIYQYDFPSETETQLTRGNSDEVAPRFSPDGKLLAFQRDFKQLVALDLAAKAERVLATALLDRGYGSGSFDWSPDSKYIAFMNATGRLYRNASIVPAAGGEPRQITFLGNTNTGNVSWSPDGRFLIFSTSQRTEDTQVVRVDLVPRTPQFREDLFRDLFKDERQQRTPPATPPEVAQARPDPNAPGPQKPETEVKPEDRKGPRARPTQVVFEGIRDRLNVLNIGLDASSPVISPDGKWLAMVATAAGQQNLYVYSLDEMAREPAVAKQLTSTAGGKRALQFTPDSKEIFYLDSGRISSVTIENPRPKPLAMTAEVDVEFDREKTEAFEEAWRALRDHFFDEKMNGADWAVLHDRYAPRIAAASTGDEYRRVLALMIGELNASHSGVNAPPEEGRTTTGRLGLAFDPAEYDQTGRLKIAEVIELSPAAIAGVKAGEYLIAVDGVKIEPHTNLDQLLEYKINKQTTLSLSADGVAAPRKVVVKPSNLNTEKGLLYRQWVRRNREYVERASGGRLGYVHMLDMSAGALTQLILDLDTENQGRKGVVIDVRNNNGGFVNAYALDVLARRGYMTMTPRGFPGAPARTLLGQRALELPTILVTNQHSLSDAEDFTEGYRTLGLGKVVGEPTAGWIIYTGSVSLIDGSSIRMPGTRITDHEGKDMEMHPRPVDVRVERPLGESALGKDSQLDAAVRELLAQIDGTKYERKVAGQ